MINLVVILFIMGFLATGCLFYLEYLPDQVDFMRGVFLLTCFLALSLLSSFVCFLITKGKEKSVLSGFSRLWIYAVRDLKHNKEEQTGKIPYFKRLIPVLLPVGAVVYMVFLFAVTELYFSNINEWQFRYEEILPVAVLAAVLLFLILSTVMALLVRSETGIGRAVVFVTSLLLLMYLQNMIMNGVGFISGGIAYHSWLENAINLLIWGCILSVPQIIMSKEKLRKYIVKGAMFLSAALFLMQLVPLPMLLLSKREGGGYRPATQERLLGDEQMTVSSEKNVIVFVLDAYYKGYFEDYLEKHPEEKETLCDFTYYDNVVSNAYYTVFSLPYMLTASDVDFGVSLAESNREAWRGSNADYFYSTMADLGYRAYLYTDSAEYAGGYENMRDRIVNVGEMELETETDAQGTYLEMSKLSLYRYMPYLLKEFFFVYDSAEINAHTKLLHDGEELPKIGTADPTGAMQTAAFYGVAVYNSDYLRVLDAGISVENGDHRVIFEHLSGMHDPYFQTDGTTPASLEEETEICMDMMHRYMNQLKESGLYDDTCIIITADHGERNVFRTDPIMLIKGFDDHGESLRVNHAPGSLQSDLLPTILDLVGADPAGIEGGESLLRLDENKERLRFIRAIGDRPEFPRRPKCQGVGFSVYNTYEEYRFYGRSGEIDPEKDSIGIFPIYDYWW